MYMKDDSKEQVEEQTQPQKIKTNKAYKAGVVFIILGSLLVFIITTALLLVKIVPDGFSLVASTYSAVQGKVEDVQEERRESLLQAREEGEELEEEDVIAIQKGEVIELREADFYVRVLRVGEILKSSRTFVEGTRKIDTDDIIAIEFRVLNIGEKTTERWQYEVDVDEPAYADDLDYVSESFAPLARGEYVDIVAIFEDIDEDGRHRFTITADSERATDEKFTSNNRVRLIVDVEED